MVGMIPVMVILRTKIPGGDDPKSPLFWGIMSLATIAASFTAYPINSWMVRRGLKHGMMTAVPASQPAATMSITMHHEGGHISMPKAVGVFVNTFAFVAISVWFTNLLVELRLW
jgi:manganese oxidase